MTDEKLKALMEDAKDADAKSKELTEAFSVFTQEWFAEKYPEFPKCRIPVVCFISFVESVELMRVIVTDQSPETAAMISLAEMSTRMKMQRDIKRAKEIMSKEGLQ